MAVNLKDLSVKGDNLLGAAKMTIPATMSTPIYYGLTIWLEDVKEPIIATYEDEDERDIDYDTVIDAME